MSDKSEVVDATSADVVLYDQNLFPDLRWADPQDMGRKFGERFDRAESVDDLFNVLEGNSTQNMVGRKVKVLDVAFQAFQSDQGVIPNGICQAVDLATGEAIEFATTSIMCTAFLRKAQLLGLLPLEVRIVEKQTRNGNKALNFERV